MTEFWASSREKYKQKTCSATKKIGSASVITSSQRVKPIDLCSRFASDHSFENRFAVLFDVSFSSLQLLTRLLLKTLPCAACKSVANLSSLMSVSILARCSLIEIRIDSHPNGVKANNKDRDILKPQFSKHEKYAVTLCLLCILSWKLKCLC